MINTVELWKAITAQLASEGTRRYTPSRDGLYAINGAMRQFEALATPLLADRKGSEESLGELQETRIFQTNLWGGLSLDKVFTTPNTQLPYEIWTVVAIYAEPFLTTTPFPILPTSKTYVRTDFVYLPGGDEERPVHRMSMEELAVVKNNKFAPGNNVMASTNRRTYGYYMQGSRSDSDTVLNGNREIVFAPRELFYPGPKYIAMSYLRSPAMLTTADIDANGNFLATSSISYPKSLFNVLRDMALNEISVKQGDGTNLYQITEREIGRLLGAQN